MDGSVLAFVNPKLASAAALLILILVSSILDVEILEEPPPPPPGTPGPHILIIKYGTSLLKSSVLASSTKTLYSNESSSSGLVLVLASPLMLTLVWTVALEMALALRLGLASRLGLAWTVVPDVRLGLGMHTALGSPCEDAGAILDVEVDIERTGGERPCGFDEPSPSLWVSLSLLSP